MFREPTAKPQCAAFWCIQLRGTRRAAWVAWSDKPNPGDFSIRSVECLNELSGVHLTQFARKHAAAKTVLIRLLATHAL